MVSVKIAGVPTTVVLLHGFAGTRRAWDPVVERLDPERYTPLAPDLRGHGDARDARPVTFEACVADVLAAAPERFVLCGYSMGGRIAQHVALAAPERVERLVLVATTAGLVDEAERAARRADDERLAAFADGATIEQFADRWAAQPLFAGTPPEAARIWREDLLRNDPRALAAVLRGMGTGAMAPLWERLPTLTMPATVLAGAEDPKFVALAERLAAALPDAELVVVQGAGHGLPREAPGAVVAALSRRSRGRAGLDAEPGLRRDRDRAVLDGQHRELVGEELERPQAAGRGRLQGGGAVHGGRDPQRPVEGRGEVDVGAGRAHERGLGQQPRDPAAARDLQAHRVGHLGRERARLAGGLVHGHADGDAVAHLAHRMHAVHGLLDQLEPGGREGVDRRDGLVDLPGAVGVQAQLHLRARRRRARRPRARRRRRCRP